MQPAEQPTVNSSTSTPVLRPTTPTLGEPEPNSQELVRQLQEKDRRIQFLEVKIQQLTQVMLDRCIVVFNHLLSGHRCSEGGAEKAAAGESRAVGSAQPSKQGCLNN